MISMNYSEANLKSFVSDVIQEIKAGIEDAKNKTGCVIFMPDEITFDFDRFSFTVFINENK
jgi:hypothetical protein